MGNREEFEKRMREHDPDQSLTLAAEYPHYASYVTCMAAHMFESRQPEIDALKAGIDSREAVIADASNAIAALKAEVERFKAISKMAGSIIHNNTSAMQAAWIEWQHGGGAEEAMQWIENTLAGPDLIPDEDDPHGKDAQAYFDAAMKETK